MVFIYGVHSIGDVAACDPVFLKGLLGVNGLGLWSYANGRDNSRVMHKDFVSPIKSVGHGITCVSDLENEQLQTRIKTFTGWTAQIIQHEIDHCEGILI